MKLDSHLTLASAAIVAVLIWRAPVVIVTSPGPSSNTPTTEALPSAIQAERSREPQEGRIAVGSTALYFRAIGQGRPMIVLHGGPDFDHTYLLPELDRLNDVYRLLYYDQRGRGKSAENVRPEDVTLASDLEDLDKVRLYFGLDSAALLAHSWGSVLALEYAIRYPGRVSHLILMNPAPISADDVKVLRKAYLEKIGADMSLQRELLASAAYQAGDPEAVSARYRIHFKKALTRPEDYEILMSRMKASFFAQGKKGIVKARAVEDRLMLDTWQKEGYDLYPQLKQLRVPTLVITGADDFIPVQIAERIARATPGAVFVNIRGCGHFTYLECGRDVRAALSGFLPSSKAGNGK